MSWEMEGYVEVFDSFLFYKIVFIQCYISEGPSIKYVHTDVWGEGVRRQCVRWHINQEDPTSSFFLYKLRTSILNFLAS